jgi:O-antigen/teichoic acid export membrane protein
MPKLHHKLPAWVWQMLLMGLLGLSGIIFVPLLLRLVDAQLMATVLVAQVYVYYLVVLVQYGFTFSGPAALARAKHALGVAQVWRSSVRAKLLLLLVPVGLVFGLGMVSLAWGQWYLLWFVLLLAAFAVNSNWFLQAQHNFAAGVGFAAVGVCVCVCVLMLWVFAGGWLGADVFIVNGAWVVVLLVLPQVCLGAGSWWLARKACAGTEAADAHWRDSLGLLRKDAPLVASQLLLLASTTLGTVVVGQLADADTTAAYAATEKLFNLGATVLVGLYMAFYPRLASFFYTDRSVYWQKIKLILMECVAGGLGLAALLAFVGPVLIGLYLPAHMALLVSPVLPPFALWLGLCISQHVLTSCLVLAERHHMVLWANGCVLVVTLLVGYAFALNTPVAWVYGMLAGQLLALVWLLMLYRKDRAVCL